MQKQITQGIKLSGEERDRLQALGKSKDRSVHWLMKQAVGEYLLREEETEQEKIEDTARWERYVLTGVHHSQTDMESWMRAKISQAHKAAL